MYPQITNILNMSMSKKISPTKGTNYAINQNTYIQTNNKLNNSTINKSNSKNLALNMLMKR